MSLSLFAKADDFSVQCPYESLCVSVYKCNFLCVICFFMQFLCVHSKTVVKLHCFLSFISSKPQRTVTMTLFDEGGRGLIGCGLEELWEMEENERTSRLNRLVGYEFVAVVSYKHDKNFVITSVSPNVK